MNVVKTKNKENDLQYVDLNRKIICKTFNQIVYKRIDDMYIIYTNVNYCGDFMNKYVQMNKLLKENNGYLFTKQIEEEGISRTYLSKFVNDNHLEKVAQGIYISEDTILDELYILQLCNPIIIYSGETALFLQNMIDREYEDICVTVPPKFSQTHLRKKGVLVHQEQNDVYQFGIEEKETIFGNIVRTYDKERCICDVVKNRRKLEVQLFQTAMKTYMRDKNKNLSKLIEYGEYLKIRDELMKYVEVMV